MYENLQDYCKDKGDDDFLRRFSCIESAAPVLTPKHFKSNLDREFPDLSNGFLGNRCFAVRSEQFKNSGGENFLLKYK